MSVHSAMWYPISYDPDELVTYVPTGGLGPMIEVYVGSGRRKITNVGWSTIERFYGHRWYDIIVLGGESISGPFELRYKDSLLANLVRSDELGKPLPPQGCPKCQHPGRFIRMALVCPTHGMFAGC